MKFNPKTEEQIAVAGLIPPGEYPFEVLFAEDQISKKENAMIKLKIGIYNAEGKCFHVTDYLVGTMESKLRHFADSTGLLPQYQSGTLSAEQTVGRTGTCRVVIKVDPTGTYNPKNEVKDYVVRKAKPLVGVVSAVAQPEVKASVDDSDVPF